jgi:hypothetical protein
MLPTKNKRSWPPQIIDASGIRRYSPEILAMGLTGVMDQNYYFSAIKNAKRLHGSPSNGFLSMYSPRVIGYPIL